MMNVSTLLTQKRGRADAPRHHLDAVGCRPDAGRVEPSVRDLDVVELGLFPRKTKDKRWRTHSMRRPPPHTPPGGHQPTRSMRQSKCSQVPVSRVPRTQRSRAADPSSEPVASGASRWAAGIGDCLVVLGAWTPDRSGDRGGRQGARVPLPIRATMQATPLQGESRRGKDKRLSVIDTHVGYRVHVRQRGPRSSCPASVAASPQQ